MALVAFEYAPTKDGLDQAARDLSESTDFILRRFAVAELSRRAEDAAPYAGVLGKALIDEDAGVRHWAAIALAGVDADAAAAQADALANALKDADPGTRCYASIALCHAGSAASPYTEALKKELLDSDPDVRIEAAKALMAANPEVASEAAELLAPKLEDKEAMFRSAAVQQLGVLGAAATPYFSNIRRTLDDLSPVVREQACHSVAHLGSAAIKACLGSLSRLATSDLEEDVRKAAATALASCNVVEALGDENAGTRLWAVRELALQPKVAEQQAERAAELLEDESCSIRLAALDALIASNSVKKYAGGVLPHLEDSSSKMRLASTRALLAADAADMARVAAAAAKYVKDHDAAARAEAAECLELSGMGALPYLQDILVLLKDEVAGVRAAAANAMRGIGKMAVFPHAHLLANLAKSDPELAVRR